MPTLHQKLEQLSQYHQKKPLIALFHDDPNRVRNWTFQLDDLHIDLSKHHVENETLKTLLEYSECCQLTQRRQDLFAGAHINHTEQRAVLHMALRGHTHDPFMLDQVAIMPEVDAVKVRCFAFAEAVRNGTWKGATGKAIQTIVNVGIGGSDLGPQLVTDALSFLIPSHLKIRFISRLDATHVTTSLADLDPETTLFVIVSKTFTTLETIENANVCRQWLVNQLGETAVSAHFVAVSTNREAVTAFGIAPEQMFEFWDWVGGRFSVWSAVGLSAMIVLGPNHFQAFLEGGRIVDQHFLTTPSAQNIPILFGLLGFWYGKYFNAPAQAILSYDEQLKHFPSFLQQLDMESNGKSIDRDGQTIHERTGPIIFGGLGNDGQHAYYQWLHQSPSFVPSDFFAPISPTYSLGHHHQLLLANCFAQSQALMLGKNAAQVNAELTEKSFTPEQISALLPYKIFTGNRPSSTILYPKMTPKILGMLIALYEHKIFVQGVLWQINSFDQWGVELGKQLANQLIPALVHQHAIPNCDPSTAALIERVLAH